MSSSSYRLESMLTGYVFIEKYPDIRELTQLLCDITHDEKVRILNHCLTLLTAATEGHTEIITIILSSLPQHRRLDVILVDERNPPADKIAMPMTINPITHAEWYGKSDSVETILTHLTLDQQLKICSDRDEHGPIGMDFFMERMGRISQYGVEFVMKEIAERKRVKQQLPTALILYSKEDREDGATTTATEEATLLESSLNKVFGHVIRQEWCAVTELEGSLHTNITGLSALCPLLFISVMSHGRMGALCGSDGVMLPVKDLIDQISRVIPAEIPLVLLVQACQSLDSARTSSRDTNAASLETDAKRGSAVGCEHIELARPNTVLLMATAARGKALRGAYIKALSAEISKADGKKQMYDMHSDAVKAMRNEMGGDLDDINQHPKYTDIMEGKKIILPKALK